jgi:hypothetical protein
VRLAGSRDRAGAARHFSVKALNPEAPFAVRVKLDDARLAASLPAGTAGTAAIYASQIKPSHIISKVILRQIAIVNYVN